MPSRPGWPGLDAPVPNCGIRCFLRVSSPSVPHSLLLTPIPLATFYHPGSVSAPHPPCPSPAHPLLPGMGGGQHREGLAERLALAPVQSQGTCMWVLGGTWHLLAQGAPLPHHAWAWGLRSWAVGPTWDSGSACEGSGGLRAVSLHPHPLQRVAEGIVHKGLRP